MLDMLPVFNTDPLLVAPLTLTHLMLLGDTPLFVFFDQFLPACLQIIHLTLPKFVGVLPGPGEVRSTAIPHLIMLDASPDLAAILAPGSSGADDIACHKNIV